MYKNDKNVVILFNNPPVYIVVINVSIVYSLYNRALYNAKKIEVRYDNRAYRAARLIIYTREDRTMRR